MPTRARSTKQRDRLAEALDLDGDVEALVSLTLMEAAKSAEEDLKAIMARVKAINAVKRRMRELMCRMSRDVVAATISGLERKGLAFSPNGLGGERAYQQVEIPVPDAESPGGIQVAVVSLVDGRITSPSQLEAALEAIRTELDSMSELGETESLRLQMAMDRRSKIMTTLSNLLKKISDTSEGIVANLK